MHRERLLPALILAVGLATWEWLVRVLAVPRWVLPPPSAIVLALLRDQRLLLQHLAVTLEEVALGLVLSVVLAILLAVGIVSSRIVERSLYPLVVASQAVPIVALAPLLLIWFGYGLTPKVIVVVLICFFPIAVNLVDGLRGVDGELVDLVRSLGASRWQTLRIVRIPAALPAFFSGLRVAAAVSVIGALIGEWVGSAAGLGYLMIRAASQFHTDRVFAAVLVSAAVSIALFWSVGVVERIALPWRTTSRTER
ncbi:ABC transporter permease [Thermomicrobium sp. 4228-Ro]|uniref:ABC transporter permease n=1 Tax=Thermomicrobium sp. 4228-Ro TaxID=2993937 RepID=UPI0022491DDB|nr:ABC transporter permease [Thermomicrobium sp. 4228-Ro]MCX2726279.1 ABC transporter permease [Thermomicrobium sp. 4228-Ro]